MPGQLDQQRAGPAGGGVDDHALALGQPGGAAQQVPGGQPLDQHRQGLPVVDVLGDLGGVYLVGDGFRGVAVGGQRGHAAAVGGAADDLTAQDVRQRLRCRVDPGDPLQVGVVDTRSGDVDQQPAGPGNRVVDGFESQLLGAAELVESDGAHGISLVLVGAATVGAPGRSGQDAAGAGTVIPARYEQTSAAVSQVSPM